MNICLFGVGGVGGYFGSLITRQFRNKHNIYFVARGAHKEAIVEKGLTLKKMGGNEIINVVPKKCTDNIDEIPICDIIIVSVKGYDLANVSMKIDKITDANTVILPLLNGVDIYDRIREYLSKGIVLQSCVYVGTHIESPGIIYQKGGSCKIAMGKDPRFLYFYPENLLKILRDSNIDYTWEEDVRISIWSKYMFIAAFGLIAAVYEKTLGEIIENVELSEKVKGVMKEINAIALKLDIPLDTNVVESSFQKANQFPFETKTSFQRDVESKGEVNEGDLFAGTLIRYGKNLGITTPNTTDVYNLLKNKFI